MWCKIWSSTYYYLHNFKLRQSEHILVCHSANTVSFVLVLFFNIEKYLYHLWQKFCFKQEKETKVSWSFFFKFSYYICVIIITPGIRIRVTQGAATRPWSLRWKLRCSKKITQILPEKSHSVQFYANVHWCAIVHVQHC